MKKESQAYPSNSTKSPAPGKGKFDLPDSGGKAPDMGEQSKAPADKPSMQFEVPAGPWSMPESGAKAPDFGAQSLAPDHKKKGLPMKNAPVGVKGVNEG